MQDVVTFDSTGNPYDRSFSPILNESTPVEALPLPSDFASFNEYQRSVFRTCSDLQCFLDQQVAPSNLSFFNHQPKSGPIMIKIPKRKQMIPLSEFNNKSLQEMLIQKNTIDYDADMPDNQGPKITIPVRSVTCPEEPWHSKKIISFPDPDLYDTYEEFEDAVDKWYDIAQQSDTIPFHPDEIPEVTAYTGPVCIYHPQQLPLPQSNEFKFGTVSQVFQLKQSPANFYSFTADLDQFDGCYEILTELHSKFMEYNQPTKLLHEFLLDGGSDIGITIFKNSFLTKPRAFHNPLQYFQNIHNLARASSHLPSSIDTTPKTASFPAMSMRASNADWPTLFSLFCALQCIFNHDFTNFSFSVQQNVDMFVLSVRLIKSFTGISGNFCSALIERTSFHRLNFDVLTNYALLILLQHHLAGFFDAYIGKVVLRPKFESQISELMKTYAKAYADSLKDNLNAANAPAICLFIILMLKTDQKTSKKFLQAFKGNFLILLSGIAAVSHDDFLLLQRHLLSTKEMVHLLYEFFTMYIMLVTPEAFFRLDKLFLSFLCNFLNCRFEIKKIQSDWIFALIGNLVQMSSSPDYANVLFALCQFVKRSVKDTKVLTNVMSMTISAISRPNLRPEVLDAFASLIRLPQSNSFLKASENWISFIIELIGSPVEAVGIAAARVIKNFGYYHTPQFGSLLKRHNVKFENKLHANVKSTMLIRVSAQIVKMFLKIAERDISLDDVGEQKPGGLIALFYGITDDMIEMAKAFCGPWYKLSEQMIRLKWSRDYRLNELGKAFDNCLKQRSSLRRLIRTAERKTKKTPGPGPVK